MTNTKQLAYTVHKLAFLLDKMADRVLQEKLALTFSQFRILIAINRNGGVSQKDIATFWEVTEAAVSRHIENLIEKDLIKAAQNKKNRREKILTLSGKGRKHLEKAFVLVDREYESIYKILEPGRRKVLTESLDKLLGHMCSDQKFDCYPKKHNKLK